MKLHTRIEGARYPIQTLLSIKPGDIELVFSERFIEEAGISRSLVECHEIRGENFSLEENKVLGMGEQIEERVLLFSEVAESAEMADALRSYLGLSPRRDGVIPLFAKKG